jgi:hypothetical protein
VSAVLWALGGCTGGGRVGDSDPFSRGGSSTPSSARVAAADSIELRGLVRSVQDGTPIQGALVILQSPSGVEWVSALSDSLGVVDLGVIIPGNLTVVVRAEGFQSVTSREEVRGLPPVRIQIQLATEADSEARSSVSVEARRDPLEAAGFYFRRDRESGSFLTAREIRMRGAVSPSEVLLTLPGFRLLQSRGAAAVVGRRGCPSNVFIDGILVGDTRQLDYLIVLQSIAALEAYPGGTPPAAFAGQGSACGAVVIWTPRSAD